MKFTGLHIAGRKRARTLGYPTINLHQVNTVSLENGVYAARVIIDGGLYLAALFIGESPTFKDKEKSIELYLIGLKEEQKILLEQTVLIKSKIEVETIQYIRPVEKFPSRNELIKQIGEDVKEIISVLSK